MKENFVIREERHPVGKVFCKILWALVTICFVVMIICALSLDGAGDDFYFVYGLMNTATVWMLIFEILVIVVGLCTLESFGGKFYVAGLQVKLEVREAIYNPFKKFEVNGNVYSVKKIDNNVISKPWNQCWYVNVPLEGNHNIELIAASLMLENIYIRLDDVIVVEDGQVYVDKIEQIMSGSVEPTNSVLRAIDIGVMPPFQTTPSHSSAEKTIAPRTKRYVIVGQAGVFENEKFDVASMLVLGRDAAECSIAFPADTAGVSRVHCKLVVGADGLCVYDLGSTYGTVVNNNKTISANQMMKLNHGDAITIGSNQTFVVKEM